MLARDENSSLFCPFVNYEENNMLLTQPLQLRLVMVLINANYSKLVNSSLKATSTLVWYLWKRLKPWEEPLLGLHPNDRLLPLPSNITNYKTAFLLQPNKGFIVQATGGSN